MKQSEMPAAGLLDVLVSQTGVYVPVRFAQSKLSARCPAGALPHFSGAVRAAGMAGRGGIYHRGAVFI